MNSDENKFWQAVTQRNAAFDGVFYYGVRSTGIFCRPSCRSRQPKRENVMFFALPEAARQAGFRSCLRCHPEKTVAQNPQAELVRRICHALETQSETQNLAALSQQMNLSESHLQRVFKSLMGITPRQYAEALRTQKFKTEVRNGKTVTAAMYEAGYGSSSRLYEKAASQLGMTPAIWRKGAKGMQINYTITDCPLGKLLVAATDIGICSVTLGDETEQLTKNLFAEFSQANINQDEAGLRNHVQTILRHLKGQQPHLDLPLDVRATAFQKRVWEELQRIPYGSTASYSDIAKRIGNPTATRAVARACATNPVALVTPCHRVVRENGELSGYRWGIERKQKLLAKEQQQKVTVAKG